MFFHTRALGARALILLSAVGLLGVLSTHDREASALSAMETFSFTGAAQSWTVPPQGVTSVLVKLYGAQGGQGVGSSFEPHSAGGKGAVIQATLAVTPGQTLTICVGGMGGTLGNEAGGFNGGGGGPYVGNVPTLSGGGGGASDIRTGDKTVGCATPVDPVGDDRLLVAGGGGGGGGNGLGTGPGGAGGAVGGDGGDGATAGTVGENVDLNTTGGGGGQPGTAVGGGAGGSGGAGGILGDPGIPGGAGGLGFGGAPGDSFPGADGGGGGGGYYGGGAGGGGGTSYGDAILSAGGGGGGGGSNLLGPDGVVLAESRLGHGLVEITYELFTQGDVDCGGIVNSVDALKVLRYVAGLPTTQTEPCVDLGADLPAAWPQGDVDCNDLVNSVDSLKLLRYVAGLSVTQIEPCPDIGAMVPGG